MQAIILLILSATLSSSFDVGDMLELPAQLGKMPKLRPPPENLPNPIETSEGMLLPKPLDAYMAAVIYTYSQIEDIGNDAIMATREADRKSCTLRLDAAKVANTKECQGCGLGKLKYWMVGSMGGFIVGAVVGAWVVHDISN